MLVKFIQTANQSNLVLHLGSKEAIEASLPEPTVHTHERLPPSEVGFGVPARGHGSRNGREGNESKIGSRVPLVDNSNGEGKIGKKTGKGNGLKEPKGSYSIAATL